MSNGWNDKQSAVPAWRRYLRFRGTDVRADVEDELEFHIEMIAARYVANGMPDDQARTRARQEFGDIERARRLCEGIGAEQERRHEVAELVDSIRKDVRFAFRSLHRAPGFAAAIVLTLALGIGASTAIFTIVRGVLLRPLPYADPDRLVRIWEVSPRGDHHNVASIGNFLSWRDQAKSFSAMGAHMAPYGVSLVGDGEPTRIIASDIMPSVMQVLGSRATLGRTFVPDDETGDGRVAVLSYGFWQRRFGLDRAVIGRRLVVDDRPLTVVGVMPQEFEFPEAGVDIWRPVTVNHFDPTERRSHNWFVIARLKPGATLDGAQAEMRTIATALAREYPMFMTGYGTNVVSMQGDVVATVRPLLLVLMAGATLLLVVACANIANLLLARAVGRQREIAVRGALGAGRGRLLRQLLTESVVIACVGGLLGVMAAFALTRGLLALAPSDIPRLAAARIDGMVLGFAVATTVASGVLFGLAPALRLVLGGRNGGQSLQAVLRAAGDRGSGRQGTARSLLLVAELAVSLVLLVGAGLLLRSAYRLAVVDYGYRPDGLVAMSLDLPRARYDSTRKHVEFYENVMERVRQLPGVAGVAATSEGIGHTGAMTFSFAIEGRPTQNASGREDPQPLRLVTPDYFRVLGIAVKRGRPFEPRDRADAPPVVIVNEALARQLWPTSDPVGARVSFVGQTGPWLDVVGVVGDSRSNAADEDAAPALFMPHAQKRWNWLSWNTVIVRTDGSRDLGAFAGQLRAVVWQQDPRIPVHSISSVPELYRQSVARRRFATVLTGAFAGAALLLGMIGMYGVLSYTVAQRRREFGIRLALGARPAQVTSVVVREALTLAALAIVVGASAAVGLTRLLDDLLYQVSPTDPVTFGGVAAVVVGVAWAAAWVPARRATQIDPATTIREA